MKNSTYKEALEILKPMHKVSHTKFVFQPQKGGYLLRSDGVWGRERLDLITYTITFARLLYCGKGTNDPDYEWRKVYKTYIPTLEQIWEQVIKFNDEYNDAFEKYLIVHNCPGNSFHFYIRIGKERTLEMFDYTDTDSMYLALLKVCVAILKIRQGEFDENI